MVLKWLFDRSISLIGILALIWLYPIVALLIKIKMPGPVLFVQKRVGKNGRLFNCHKFRTMVSVHNGLPISVAGESRITPLGAKLRHYKIDELPELWDVFIGNMSFVGPRPDVPGYADQLKEGDRDLLLLRPGITGPATLKYRAEEDLLATIQQELLTNKQIELADGRIISTIKEYNDYVIFPDKVRLNLLYYRNYSFWDDIRIIVATVFGYRIVYNGEII